MLNLISNKVGEFSEKAGEPLDLLQNFKQKKEETMENVVKKTMKEKLRGKKTDLAADLLTLSSAASLVPEIQQFISMEAMSFFGVAMGVAIKIISKYTKRVS